MGIIIEKKITTEYKKVMLTESLYSLALYIFINENVVDDTLFLLGDNINYSKITGKLSNYVIYDCDNAVPKNKFELILLSNKLFFGRFKKIGLFLNASYLFFGHDHVSLSPMISGYKVSLIEDGLSNYSVINVENNLINKIKKILGLRLAKKGYDPKTELIYLTGMYEIPNELNDKCIVINRDKFISSLSNLLSGVFYQRVNGIENVQLIITQPLSEDGFLSEKEKIKIYKEMINENLPLVIKPHPREVTNYKFFFPEAIVIDKEVLAESLFESEIIKEIKTIFSSAVINYPFKKGVSVYIKGTAFDNRLLNHFGCVDEIIVNK